ncbi:MAG: SDR family oxidoreductase [Archangium sp.]|nr:SDR family oxidoreductase [Archangium sp.]
MARIAILGGTGKLGQRLATRSLELGFRVNVLGRDLTQVRIQNEGLSLMAGNAETGQGLDTAFSGCAYVVCCIGSLSPVLDRVMQEVIPRLEDHKLLKRFVFVSRLGTGESRDQARLVSGPLQSALPVLLMPIFKDINLAEARVRASKLPYTILRSTRLTDGPATGGVVAVGPRDAPPHRVTRADLADYVVKLIQSTDALRGEVTVGSR